MKKKWNNKIYNRSIYGFYDNLQNEMATIISGFFDIIYDKDIDQVLPNKFYISGIIIECKLNDPNIKENLITIEFPEVQIYNGKLNLFIEEGHRKIGQYLFCNFLDEKFDYDGFCKQMGACINVFCEKYYSFIHDNFSNIRANYFLDSNRELSQYEIDFFSKTSVLLKCETSEQISHYGYKPGEGHNYEHSFSVSYADVNQFDDKKVINYIKKLNDSNPKDSDTEYLEMYPSNFSDILQIEYFDLELSKKINHYILLNKEPHRNHYFDFEDIKHNPIIKKNKNNFTSFECIVLIYVLTKFDLEKIKLFFKTPETSKNRDYLNIVLLSQYFVNKEHSTTVFTTDFRRYRENIINELWSTNFGNKNSYNEVLFSFKTIGGTEEELKELMYFYINFTSKYYSKLDYNHIINIFYNYFKSKNDR